MESPLTVPPELLRQTDALFSALVANPDLEQDRMYRLPFGIFPLGAVLLADRYGEAGRRAAANMIELDYRAGAKYPLWTHRRDRIVTVQTTDRSELLLELISNELLRLRLQLASETDPENLTKALAEKLDEQIIEARRRLELPWNPLTP